MDSRARVAATIGERLVGVLVPVPVAGRPSPVPVPMPILPPRPSLCAPVVGSPSMDIARMDGSGRVSARHLLAALRWVPGHRVDVDVVGGVVHIGSAAGGVHVVGSRGELGLPAAARAMCGLGVGPPVLLVADPPRDRVLVYPISLVADLLSTWHARRPDGGGTGG